MQWRWQKGVVGAKPHTYKSPNGGADSAMLSLLLWPASATKQFIEKWTQSAAP